MMKVKRGAALFWVAFLLFALLSAALPPDVSGSQSGNSATEPKTWRVDDGIKDCPDAKFTGIQDAVDAASPGDTIIIYPGTYTENVDVNKDHLTIKSQNGAEVTIAQAAHLDDHVFEVTANYVNISEFRITGSSGVWGWPGSGIAASGIGLYTANYCNVSDNILSENECGIIHLAGEYDYEKSC